MADIVNLRTARKRKARAEKEQAASENRARFGRTRDAKVTERLNSEMEARRLDAHKRASSVPPEKPATADPDGDGGA